MSERELLLGSSFHLSLGAGGDGAAVGGTAFTAWGRASSSRFDGEADGLALDGDVTTFTLGADAAQEGWLAGVAVSLSEGEGSYRDHADTDHESRGSGELESSLTGVHPYARLSLSERLSLWGVLGFGTGKLTLETDGGQRFTTDTEAADGGRRRAGRAGRGDAGRPAGGCASHRRGGAADDLGGGDGLGAAATSRRPTRRRAGCG